MRHAVTTVACCKLFYILKFDIVMPTDMLVLSLLQEAMLVWAALTCNLDTESHMFCAGTGCPSRVALCTERRQTKQGFLGKQSALLVFPTAVLSRSGCLRSTPQWYPESSSILCAAHQTRCQQALHF